MHHQEKRDFRRMTVEAPVSIKYGDRKIQGVCKDLSGTGMLIHISEPVLSAGAQIQVLLDTSDSRFPSLHAEANVVRVKEESGEYVVATEFTAML